MKRTVLLLTVLFIVISCSEDKNYHFVNNTLFINQDNSDFEISALSPDIIKVVYTDSLNTKRDVIAPVLKTPFPILFQEVENKLILSTENVAVHITLNPFEITYLDRMDGVKTFQTNPVIKKGDSLSIQFQLANTEKIYGTGGRALPLNRRGYRFLHYNQPQYGYGVGDDALNYSIPHVMSSENYMLLFDNPARSYFDIGHSRSDELSFASLDGNSTYYFINGDTPNDLLVNYSDLTGHQDLPPIWAFGNLLSRFGYRSQAEAEQILDKTLKAGYPVDAIVLDIYWFGPELEDGKMGQLDWDYDRWPEPKSMIDKWKKLGVNTISVSEPFFTKKSQYFQELSDQGLLAKDSLGRSATIPDFYFGEAALLDIFQPQAQGWIWEKYKYIRSFGVDGLWVDLGEPEKHPDYMIHTNGKAYEVHGAYGHEWAKTIYEGYKRDYPKERLFHMGRSGFAGTQRYGLIPWSGDVSRSWSGLKAQPSILMSMALSGLGYMHSDAGGFSMAQRDDELYIRWLQFAVFTPVFRPHADAMLAPEPVFWDKKTQSIVKKYIDLRYKLLPYNYNLAWQNSVFGTPLMRPLFYNKMDHPDWASNEYFWGDDLLIVPILDPSINLQKVFLPEGNWYNFWVNDKIGSGTYDMRVGIDNIPVFVKEGAILLQLATGLKNTKMYNSSELEVTYYLSTDESIRSYYFDDGKTTNAYQRGLYERLHLKFTPGENKIVFNTRIDGDGYEEAPNPRKLNVRIIGLETEPKSLDVDKVDFKYEDGVLSFSVMQGEEVQINLN